MSDLIKQSNKIVLNVKNQPSVSVFNAQKVSEFISVDKSISGKPNEVAPVARPKRPTKKPITALNAIVKLANMLGSQPRNEHWVFGNEDINKTWRTVPNPSPIRFTDLASLEYKLEMAIRIRRKEIGISLSPLIKPPGKLKSEPPPKQNTNPTGSKNFQHSRCNELIGKNGTSSVMPPSNSTLTDKCTTSVKQIGDEKGFKQLFPPILSKYKKEIGDEKVSKQLIPPVPSKYKKEIGDEKVSKQQIQPVISKYKKEIGDEKVSKQPIQPVLSKYKKEIGDEKVLKQPIQPVLSKYKKEIGDEKVSKQPIPPVLSTYKKEIGAEKVSKQPIPLVLGTYKKEIVGEKVSKQPIPFLLSTYKKEIGGEKVSKQPIPLVLSTYKKEIGGEKVSKQPIPLLLSTYKKEIGGEKVSKQPIPPVRSKYQRYCAKKYPNAPEYIKVPFTRPWDLITMRPFYQRQPCLGGIGISCQPVGRTLSVHIGLGPPAKVKTASEKKNVLQPVIPSKQIASTSTSKQAPTVSNYSDQGLETALAMVRKAISLATPTKLPKVIKRPEGLEAWRRHIFGDDQMVLQIPKKPVPKPKPIGLLFKFSRQPRPSKQNLGRPNPKKIPNTGAKLIVFVVNGKPIIPAFTVSAYHLNTYLYPPKSLNSRDTSKVALERCTLCYPYGVDGGENPEPTPRKCCIKVPFPELNDFNIFFSHDVLGKKLIVHGFRRKTRGYTYVNRTHEVPIPNTMNVLDFTIYRTDVGTLIFHDIREELEIQSRQEEEEYIMTLPAHVVLETYGEEFFKQFLTKYTGRVYPPQFRL